MTMYRHFSMYFVFINSFNAHDKPVSILIIPNLKIQIFHPNCLFISYAFVSYIPSEPIAPNLKWGCPLRLLHFPLPPNAIFKHCHFHLYNSSCLPIHFNPTAARPMSATGHAQIRDRQCILARRYRPLISSTLTSQLESYVSNEASSDASGHV